MMQRFATVLLTAPIAVLVAACGDVTAPRASGDLTLAEATELAYQMSRAGISTLDASTGMLGSFASSGAGTFATATGDDLNQTFTRTVPCPEGGVMSMSGTVFLSFDRSAGTFGLRSEMTSAPNECGFVAGAESAQSSTAPGTTIRITGELAQTTEASGSGASGGAETTTSFTSSSVQTGSFSYATSDGRTNSCTVDIRSAVNLSTRSYQVEGTFCGHTIDESRTFSTDSGRRGG